MSKMPGDTRTLEDEPIDPDSVDHLLANQVDLSGDEPEPVAGAEAIDPKAVRNPDMPDIEPEPVADTAANEPGALGKVGGWIGRRFRSTVMREKKPAGSGEYEMGRRAFLTSSLAAATAGAVGTSLFSGGGSEPEKDKEGTESTETKGSEWYDMEEEENGETEEQIKKRMPEDWKGNTRRERLWLHEMTRKERNADFNWRKNQYLEGKGPEFTGEANPSGRKRNVDGTRGRTWYEWWIDHPMKQDDKGIVGGIKHGLGMPLNIVIDKISEMAIDKIAKSRQKTAFGAASDTAKNIANKKKNDRININEMGEDQRDDLVKLLTDLQKLRISILTWDRARRAGQIGVHTLTIGRQLSHDFGELAHDIEATNNAFDLASGGTGRSIGNVVSVIFGCKYAFKRFADTGNDNVVKKIMGPTEEIEEMIDNLDVAIEKINGRLNQIRKNRRKRKKQEIEKAPEQTSEQTAPATQDNEPTEPAQSPANHSTDTDENDGEEEHGLATGNDDELGLDPNDNTDNDSNQDDE